MEQTGVMDALDLKIANTAIHHIIEQIAALHIKIGECFAIASELSAEGELAIGSDAGQQAIGQIDIIT